jgi:lipopolysaccharide biosynthesis regulator YciM
MLSIKSAEDMETLQNKRVRKYPKIDHTYQVCGKCYFKSYYKWIRCPSCDNNGINQDTDSSSE